MTRFKKDAAAQQALSRTSQLADAKAEDYDTIFYVGGHGPMWDRDLLSVLTAEKAT